MHCVPLCRESTFTIIVSDRKKRKTTPPELQNTLHAHESGIFNTSAPQLQFSDDGIIHFVAVLMRSLVSKAKGLACLPRDVDRCRQSYIMPVKYRTRERSPWSCTGKFAGSGRHCTRGRGSDTAGVGSPVLPWGGGGASSKTLLSAAHAAERYL